MRARTVVSGGLTQRLSGMSSKPASAMSAGTRRPASLNAERQPIAIMSLLANTALGRCTDAAIRLPARKPESCVKSPCSTCSSRPGSRSAIAAR